MLVTTDAMSVNPVSKASMQTYYIIMMPLQRWECHRCRLLQFLDDDRPENPILEYICIVKRLYKLLGVLLLASIYFFGISAGREHTFSPTKKVFGQDTNQGTFISATKATSLCQIPKPESFVDHVNDLPFSLDNVFFTSIFGAQRPREFLFGAKARQYLGFSINFLVRHRKADLIFPFHYFW